MKRLCAIIFVLDLFNNSVGAPVETSEDTNYLMSNNMYAQPPVNFNEINTNSISQNTDDVLAAVTQEELHLTNLASQFAEFHPHTIPTTTTSTSSTTTPKPRFPPPAYARAQQSTEEPTSTTTTTTTTTDAPEEVQPLKVTHQRGVLDLIFPAVRVKNFKHFFDSFRRILSRTFR